MRGGHAGIPRQRVPSRRITLRGGAIRERVIQTNADASNTQLTSPFAKPSKWFGGANATRLFMSQ